MNRRNYSHVGIELFAGLAVLSAMSGGSLPRKSTRCTYRSFCGPPWPTTRQQRRQLERMSAKAGRRLAAEASDNEENGDG